MIRKLILSGFSLLTLCVIFGVAYYSKNPARDQALDNKGSSAIATRSAPDFELSSAEGQKVKLKDLRGNLIVVHFWASWCPPCLEEIGKWVEFANSFHGRSIKWVAISLDQNWPDALKVLPTNRLSKSMISVLDPTSKVAELYGTFQFPETYLVSSDLKIITKWVGPQDWEGNEIRKFIEDHLH